MKKLNNKGFGVVEVLLILVIVGLIGGIGWYIVNGPKKADVTITNTTPAPTVKTAPKQSTAKYTNDELKFSIEYPKDWGNASIKKGDVGSPASGGYQQVTFSTQKLVDINLVTEAYSTPLDGCGLSPLESEKFILNSKRASTIGWISNNIKTFWTGQGFGKPTVVLENSKPGDHGAGWSKLSVVNKVLEYKDLPKTPYKAETKTQNGCYDVTAQEATEANSYAKFIRFAVNFSNKSVKGVNAQYDARTSTDIALVKQIVSTLNSIK